MTMAESKARVGNAVCIECAASFFIAFDVDDTAILCPLCKEENPLPAAQRSYPAGRCTQCGDPIDAAHHRLEKDGAIEYKLVSCKRRI